MVKGRVGNGEGAAAKDGCIRWDLERLVWGNRVGNVGGYDACDGVIEGEDGVFYCSAC